MPGRIRDLYNCQQLQHPQTENQLQKSAGEGTRPTPFNLTYPALPP
jgi:hypothetical protein